VLHLGLTSRCSCSVAVGDSGSSSLPAHVAPAPSAGAGASVGTLRAAAWAGEAPAEPRLRPGCCAARAAGLEHTVLKLLMGAGPAAETLSDTMSASGGARGQQSQGAVPRAALATPPAAAVCRLLSVMAPISSAMQLLLVVAVTASAGPTYSSWRSLQQGPLRPQGTGGARGCDRVRSHVSGVQYCFKVPAQPLGPPGKPGH
jgi:hypothetical protein